jgi:hypothetical protein
MQPVKCSVEFRFQEFLDETANADPHPGFKGSNQSSPRKSVPSDASSVAFMVSVFTA